MAPTIIARIQDMQVTYRDQTWTFDESLTVMQMLNRVDLLPESVLVVRNGKLVTEDQRLSAGDEVKIVSVISGG
jgi:thiamine biosynthesis protein ThiS